MGGSAVDAHLVLAFVVATALLSLAPGPDMLFVIANGVAGGKRAGVVAALGMSTGLAVHTLAAALGLSLLLSAAPEALAAVRLGGGAVLLYLAVTTWRSSRRAGGASVTARPRRSLRRTYLMATLTNLANPKVILFYLAFVPQFLTTEAGAWPVAVQMVVLGTVFIVVGLCVDGPAGVLSGLVSDKVLARPRLRQRMEQGSALVFAGLGARLVLDRSG
jgi:threonine/homoserine/homoserine lactone efflux protein